jgi:hypothetical protein
MDENSTFEILCRAMAAAYFAQNKPVSFSTITIYLHGVFRDAEDTSKMDKLADELYQSVQNKCIFCLPDAPEKVIRVIVSCIHKGKKAESDSSTKRAALFMEQMMYWCGVLDCLLQKQDARGQGDEILSETQRSLKLHLARIAKKSRKRDALKTSGRTLVEHVRRESKKRNWKGAWDWLCLQAENHVSVENFSLESVDGDRQIVRFWNQKTGSIKKTTFQKYWAKKFHT